MPKNTKQLLNIICNTLQNWRLGCRLHDDVKLTILNLIIQKLVAFNFEELAFQCAISRARDVLFAIPFNWTSVEAAHVAEDLQPLNVKVAPGPY